MLEDELSCTLYQQQRCIALSKHHLVRLSILVQFSEVNSTTFWYKNFFLRNKFVCFIEPCHRTMINSTVKSAFEGLWNFIKTIKETAFKTLMITVFKNSNTFSPTCNKNQLNDNACKLPHIQCAHCGKKLGCAFELTGIST